ncbi:MAG: S8 family serine peptidase [Actinobacteria bacterium]|nr:S8 family serine peptidase [Actinomycetota bacterium]
MRKLRAMLVVACASASLVTVQPSTPSARAEGGAPADSTDPGAETVTDPRLLDEMEQSLDDAASEPRGGVATVPVEILTTDVVGVATRVRAAGGTITGSVPGALVQATVPVAAVESLAESARVSQVQYPRRAGHAPVVTPARTEAIGTGPTLGSEVASTGADLWQTAGHLGTGVKVGIVDFFDFTAWAPAEHGALPDAAHQFCRDTTGTVPNLCNPNGTISSAAVLGTESGHHGVAVAEIVRDMAPGVELFVASVGTTADLQAAVDFFGANGVTILTRSLGSAYDGPGDGTGPLATVVDSAIGKGMTWFNSAGNDAFDLYMRRAVPTSLARAGYVNFNDGLHGAQSPINDTWLRVDSGPGGGGCYVLDGIRWSNDWYLAPAQRSDYSIEFWEPISSPGPGNDWVNPTAVLPVNVDGAGGNVIDANQLAGADPLEAVDRVICPTNRFSEYNLGESISYIRIRLNPNTRVGAVPDTLEIALATGMLEKAYSDATGSAAKPVVDSRNPGLVAVAAYDPAPGWILPGSDGIGYYSSQGPTTDGRIKPDVTAPSGFASTVFVTFHGTSAAAPTAAGAAALLQGAGLATPGAGLAALVKHFVTDLGPAGADNAYGAGLIHLPPPPDPAVAATPGKFVPMALPQRVLDTRQGAFHVGPAGTVGPYTPQSIFDFNVRAWSTIPAGAQVSAVAINLTAVAPPSLGFVQSYPYLKARNGGTSTLNVSTPNVTRPNFAIVPLGQNGNISVYVQAGGNVIIDLLGYYLADQVTPTDGRFVPLTTPERWMDTRGGASLPASFGGTPRRVNATEEVTVPLLAGTQVPDITAAGSQVSALVVNVAAVNAEGSGFLRVYPGGAVNPQHANVNYVPGSASANTAIVPIGHGGAISLAASQTIDMIVDVVGYITSSTAAASPVGTFVPLTPTRAYDTRALGQPFTAGETRGFYVTGGTTGVPDGIGGISANLTVVAPGANGFLKVYPGLTPPPTASVNYAAGKTVANGALVGVNQIGVSNSVTAAMSQSGHLIIDINGYFVAASS